MFILKFLGTVRPAAQTAGGELISRYTGLDSDKISPTKRVEID